MNEVMRRYHEVAALPIYRNRNLTMMTDLYQLTMMYGYYKSGRMNQEVVFDTYFRKNPSGSGYVVAAGLEQAIIYLMSLRFTEEDLAYLRSLELFDEGFLDELRRFRFTGSLYAMPEGTIAFANEPLLRFRGRILELQLIESAILSFVNHQTLIATKASRLVHSARTELIDLSADTIMEFGLRRAQNADAANFGARAAYIGGCIGTSNVYAGQNFGIPVMGTMAHSWVQSFPSELEAFRAYANAFPDKTVLLVDTYNTLQSGMVHAIQVAREMRERGQELLGVRLDSGDLAYLSKEARRMLDEAGFPDVKIVASSDLDEGTIRDLIIQGARIDQWGVGTSLITSKDCPSLGGVYKLVAEVNGDEFVPRIKVSENPQKITNPGYKRVVRLYDAEGMATADLICLDEEVIDTASPMELFDPVHTYKRKVVRNFTTEELLIPIIENGELVYQLPTIHEIRKRVTDQLKRFPEEVKRLINPHEYHVDLSLKLWTLKQELLSKSRAGACENEQDPA
jgi:nicotinate phosphoribosyltransferase